MTSVDREADRQRSEYLFSDHRTRKHVTFMNNLARIIYFYSVIYYTHKRHPRMSASLFYVMIERARLYAP